MYYQVVENLKNNHFFRKVSPDLNFDCFGVYNYDFWLHMLYKQRQSNWCEVVVEHRCRKTSLINFHVIIRPRLLEINCWPMFMRKKFHITTTACVSLSLIFRTNSFCKNILPLFLCIINGLSTPIYRVSLCNHLFDWQHIQTSLIIYITALWSKLGFNVSSTSLYLCLQYPPRKRFLRNCCLYRFMGIECTETPFMTTKCHSLDIKHKILMYMYTCTKILFYSCLSMYIYISDRLLSTFTYPLSERNNKQNFDRVLHVEGA